MHRLSSPASDMGARRHVDWGILCCGSRSAPQGSTGHDPRYQPCVLSAVCVPGPFPDENVQGGISGSAMTARHSRLSSSQPTFSQAWLFVTRQKSGLADAKTIFVTLQQTTIRLLAANGQQGQAGAVTLRPSNLRACWRTQPVHALPRPLGAFGVVPTQGDSLGEGVDRMGDRSEHGDDSHGATHLAGPGFCPYRLQSDMCGHGCAD